MLVWVFFYYVLIWTCHIFNSIENSGGYAVCFLWLCILFSTRLHYLSLRITTGGRMVYSQEIGQIQITLPPQSRSFKTTSSAPSLRTLHMETLSQSHQKTHWEILTGHQRETCTPWLFLPKTQKLRLWWSKSLFLKSASDTVQPDTGSLLKPNLVLR